MDRRTCIRVLGKLLSNRRALFSSEWLIVGNKEVDCLT